MRNIFVSLIILALFVSVSTAEMLLTADSLGQGRIGLQALYVSTTNHTQSLNNNVSYGGLIGYGLMPALDVYGILGFTDFNNMGSIGTTANGPLVGAALKYRLLEEAPVSLSSVASFRSTNFTVKSSFSQSNTVIEDWMGGLILSKNVNNVVPYLGAAYHALSYLSSPGTFVFRVADAEINGGVKFNPVEGLGVILEYAYHSWVPTSGLAQNFSNISLSVGTKL